MVRLLVICVMVLVGFLYISNTKNDKLSSDIVILTDSISIHKNKNKDLVYSVNSAEISLKTLKEINNNLYDEIKTLKDNPLVVYKNVVEVKYDTI